MKYFQKLKILNFGPIVTTGSKMLEFKRCTVFIGDQGTGKSTIAKVYSSLVWFEKAIVAKKTQNNQRNIEDIKKLFSQQNIPYDYFNKNTIIEYESNVLSMHITINSVKIIEKEFLNKEYKSPQIQYIPSERNLLSISDSLNKISGLPEIINQFSNDFSDAKNTINTILFQKYAFKYDSKSGVDYVIANNDELSKVTLKQASSGIQSVYPLLFVSKFLSGMVRKSFFERLKETDNNRRQRIFDSIKYDNSYSIIKDFISSGIDKEIKKINELKFESEYGCIVDSCLIEIIEEPEQNLYPISQIELLKNIVTDTNGQFDRLILTTHSPYILSQINNYIYASQKYKNFKRVVKELGKDVFIDFNSISAYKIKNGKIKSIIDKNFEGIDVLEIDECSRNIASIFDKLVDINE